MFTYTSKSPKLDQGLKVNQLMKNQRNIEIKICLIAIFIILMWIFSPDFIIFEIEYGASDLVSLLSNEKFHFSGNMKHVDV